jgi:hypothetical protein
VAGVVSSAAKRRSRLSLAARRGSAFSTWPSIRLNASPTWPCRCSVPRRAARPLRIPGAGRPQPPARCSWRPGAAAGSTRPQPLRSPPPCVTSTEKQTPCGRCYWRSSGEPASRRACGAAALPDVTPEWLERYSNLESEPAVIGTYEAEVIPGLLQTERCVRAIILTWSSVSSSCACSISGCIVARDGIGCGPSSRTVPPPPAAAAWPAEVESSDQPGRASRLSLSYRLRSAGGRFESGCVPLSLGLE